MKRTFTKFFFWAVLSLLCNNVLQAQIVNLYAGSAAGTGGYTGDGSPLTAYELSNMRALAWDHNGNMYVCDNGNNRIRKITGTTITTIAGSGTAGFGGDGGPATAAACKINGPMEIVVDAAGTVFFTDASNNRVRKISSAGIISTVAGNGTAGWAGDGGPATAAGVELNQPVGLVFDRQGNLLIADQFNECIRKITPAGIISTIYGTHGVGGFTGDGGGYADTCKMSYPYYMRYDMWGNLFFEDRENERIREITPSGLINTVIETPPNGFTGDGGPASAATLSYLPGDLHFDGAGNLYIADRTNWNIRKVTATDGHVTGSSIITSSAGTNVSGFTGDGGPATVATFKALQDALADTNGNYYISDAGNNVIRRVGADNQRPHFVNGHNLTLSVCENTTFDSFNTLLPVSDTDHSGTLTWNIFSGPFHGTANGHYTVSEYAGGYPYAAHGLYYTPTTGYYGNDTIVMWVNDGHAMDTTQIIITVNPLPFVDVIVGPGTICQGSTVTYTDDSSGGIWTSSTPAIVSIIPTTGVATGNTVGTANIIYTITNSCGPTAVTFPVTVAVMPVAISPSSAVVCTGITVILTDPTSGGTWSDFNGDVSVVGGAVTGVSAGIDSVYYTIGTCVVSAPVTVNATPAALSPASATICIGSAVTFTDATPGGAWSMTNTNATHVAGVVTGAVVGLDTVKYTITGCSATAPVTVVASPAAISPANTTVCTGQTVTLTDATGGGAWSASNAHGSVAGGIVTGISAGIDTISYSLGTCVSKAYVTVNASPAAISPASATICVGSTVSLTDATGGGTWSAQNGDATVVGGLVTGISAGVDNISYTAGSCSSVSAITVVTAPAPLSPASASVCVGGTVTFTDATGGGIWSMVNGDATVAGGVVTGVSVGSDSVVYTIGSCFVKAPVSVNALPSAITPGTPVSVCVGSTTTLGDATPGGVWSSSAPGIAIVGTGGVVTGVAPGTVTISYTSGAGCSATKLVTVLLTPAAISPASATVCVGNTVVLSDATSGGIWSETTGNTTVAGGVVTGVTAGTDIISYTIGTCYSTAVVTINGLPSAISPAGPVTICVGGTATFTDATPGGTWSSSAPGTATIAGGVVTGVSAGTVTISYSNALGCAATEQMTVSVTPTAIVPASSLICVGNTVPLTDAVGGGVWSSVAPGIASVAGGVVTGVAVGNTTINYSIGTCTASATVTVSIPPVAGTITGPSNVCVGGNITLTDPAGGGTWSSSSAGIASVSGTGIVTGVSGGIATISYTVSNACGSVSATRTVNVVPSGVLPITGLGTICAGTFTTMTDATSGGSWSVSNATASITGTGLLTGITPGTDTIIYSVTNVCGTSSTTKSIVVGAFLSAGTITGGNSVCAGSTITLADLAPGGVWGATNGNATVAGGVVTGVTGGVDTITYTVTSSCGSAVATHNITVNPIPTGGTITGPANICIGSFVPYTDAATGGVWSITNAHATITLSGVVNPVSVGADTIVYTVTNACGTASANKVITVGSALTAGSISGPSMVCTGTPVTLTDAAPGGVWSASNGHATISGTGLVNGVTAGIDTISYTVTGSCGTVSAVQLMTVNLSPAAGSITGAATICLGTPSAYTDASPGGVWSISNTHAAIAGSGVVTPVSIGTDTVIYTVTNVCGSAAATKSITIGGTVTAGTITGPLNVCIGSAITLTDAAPGGVWSASNGHATAGGGTVTGISAGADTIAYTVTTACGSAAATAILTVSPVPSGGVIVGPSSMCMGSFTIYTDASTGGVWSISNANATITSGGLVTAMSLGNDTITYTVTNGCGTASATKNIIIGAALTAGTITGPNAVCVGSNITLADATGGGVWSSVNGNATVGITGTVTGVSAGTDSILYTVTSSCGSVAATYGITVYSVTPTGTITGPSAVCFGSSASESDVIAGGTWSAVNSNATVSGTGVVNGITPGLDTIIYTVAGVCGTASATKPMEIDGTALAAPVTGLSAVCAGSGITLTDATPGGVWSSSNTNAMVTGPGIIEGVTTGTDTILYLYTNACGTATVYKLLTINPVPLVAAITGPTTQCTGTTITLNDATTSGVWTSSTPAVATIGLSSGVVTGITAGISTLTYTVTNSFGCPGTVSSQDTVTMISGVPAITGSTNVCLGSAVTLSDTDPGGSWTSSSPGIATAGATTGVVTGVTAGTVTITYTLSTSCGTAFVTASETVNPLPVVSAISGTASECVGATTTLTDATGGGAWSSADAFIAAVGTSTGIVTGISSGTTVINYTVTSTFGCVGSVSVMNTVNVTPSVAAITGTPLECTGGTSTLSDATGGGTWTSSNPAVATVSGSGLVTGITSGVVTITYGVGSGGCTGYAVKADTVNSIPVASPITGSTNVCTGATSTLADAAPGGIWSSGSPAVATISVTGVVTGVSTGSDQIYYAITNSCGSVTDSVTISVTNTASAGTITGSTVVCQGATITLADATAGGSWSATNGHAAVGTSVGLVTGVSAGTDTIKYTVTNTCGTATATKVISVSSAPYPGSISGYTSLCAGTTISLSESVTGGAWSSSNSSAASVSSGLVTGITAGSATISYSVTNSCGTRSATHPVTVEAAGTCNTLVNTAGSISEIKVYPNPATTVLQIEAPKTVNVTVLSVEGKMVISLKDVTSVDVSKLANGLYFINVYDNSGLLLKTAKFVKAE